jgi:hypothetical protein
MLKAKCRTLELARVVFDRITKKTLTSFNTILVGYLNSEIRDEDTTVFFRKLRFNGVNLIK